MMGIIVQLEDVIVELLRSDRKVATDKMAVVLNATKELEPRLRNITQIIREYMEAINVRQD